MADQKVSDLPSLNGVDVDPADLLYIIDSSAGSAGSKKITVGQYQLAPVSSGAANGVLYLNGSKVATAGSDLVFDGTNLGIGASSPAQKLHVNNTTGVNTYAAFSNSNATNGNYVGTAANGNGIVGTVDIQPLLFLTSAAERMRLDTSGNLGLGVTPSAWGNLNKALQLSGTGAVSSTVAGNTASRLSHGAYFDNTNWRYTDTSIGAARYEMTGANAGSTHAWYVSAGGTAGNTISFTQAMTLDASGNLLVGATANPGVLNKSVVINSGASSLAGLVLQNNATGSGSTDGSHITINGTELLITNRENDATIFANNGSERARITPGGEFLVGTTNASVGTAVGCRIVDSGARLEVAKAATTNADIGLSQYSTGAGAYRFYVGYGGTVYATSTTITAISDQRLKENIRDLDVGLDKIMALKPRKFDWKPGKGKDKKNDRGWIAQEFEQVFPDMVDTWQDPAPEGEEPYKAVNADLIPVLVKAIQEQQAIIEDLRARVAALESA